MNRTRCRETAARGAIRAANAGQARIGLASRREFYEEIVNLTAGSPTGGQPSATLVWPFDPAGPRQEGGKMWGFIVAVCLYAVCAFGFVWTATSTRRR